MIIIKNISKSYGKKKILFNACMEAGPGELAVIVGRNGCGKTTLMRILAGILRPDTGQMTYFGKDVLKERSLFEKMCGYLPQENPLIEELSVQDNISLWSGKTGPPEQRLTDMFQLEEMLKTPVARLSGGMKRRVSIACAVVKWPPILIMDEPTTALDIYFKDNVHEIMQKYRKMGGIIIMTSHDEKEIAAGDRRFVLADGVMKNV